MEDPSRDPEARNGQRDRARPEQRRPAGSGGPTAFYRSAWGAYLVLAIVGVLWAGHHHGDISLSIFLDPARWWVDLGLGLAAGTALLGLWIVARRLLPQMARVETDIRRLVGPLEPSEALALAIISGFAEELFFRGAMQSSWGWGWALAIFTVLHTGPGRAFRYWTAFAFVAGGLFAWLTLERGTLLAAIVAHILVNGVNLTRLARMPLPEVPSPEVPIPEEKE